MLTRAAIVAVLAVVALPLKGQSWSIQPNGEWGYTHNLTTRGLFQCGDAQYFLAGGGCTAAGNTLTLISATSSMTVTFTASTQTVVATNARDRDLVMGTLTKTFSGSAFSPPELSSQFATLFTFQLLLSSSTPISTSASMNFSYTSRSSGLLPSGSQPDYVVLALLAPPSPLTYGALVYNTFRGTDISLDVSPQTITARVGIVPEPSAVALTAGGVALLVVAGTRRARREHSSDDTMRL